MTHSTTQNTEDQCTRAEDEYVKQSDLSNSGHKNEPIKIIWKNVIVLSLLHLLSVYAIYFIFASAKWQTNVFAFILHALAGMGLTAGAHRLWAHRSYKARLPLRIFLAFAFTVALENDIYDWCRNHRVHHKFSETDADPHNAKRGFFFAHVGWLMCRKHPDVKKKGKVVELGDLWADPIVRFHKKYYHPLAVLCCIILPTAIPMCAWNETFSNAFLIPTLFRICFTYNTTWLVNSAAHMWGSRPYDAKINPRENFLVSVGTGGEGFHNYHHSFPYDYSASEYGIKYNVTTAYIDLFAWLGLAYDRKTAARESITARKLRSGENNLRPVQQQSDLVKKD